MHCEALVGTTPVQPGVALHLAGSPMLRQVVGQVQKCNNVVDSAQVETSIAIDLNLVELTQV